MTSMLQQSFSLQDCFFRKENVTRSRLAPLMPHMRYSGRSGGLCIAAKAQQKPLVVVGSINADMVLEIGRIPAEGETLAAKALTSHPGGKVGVFVCDTLDYLSTVKNKRRLAGRQSGGSGRQAGFPNHLLGPGLQFGRCMLVRTTAEFMC